MSKTIDNDELDKFAAIADEWWQKDGKFKVLHKFNPIRCEYILQEIAKRKKNSDKNDLSQLKILDIGCGGGLVSEMIANSNADITAIDPIEKNIMIAKAHQKKSQSKVNYIHSTLDKLPKNKKFDVILCLEVIEHVTNPKLFVTQMSDYLKSDGILFIATINRTVTSLLGAKFIAEYVLNWVPKKTHDWKKFLKPAELNQYAQNTNLTLQNMSGFNYNIFNDEWRVSRNVLQNYIMSFKKI